MRRASFEVHVDEKTGGYVVSVVKLVRGKPQDFATVDAHLLDVALRMALPYMASVAEPDPFAAFVGVVEHERSS